MSKHLLQKILKKTVASLNQVEYGEEIAKAAALYADKKNLQIFDTYFDKILYLRLVKALKSGDIDASRLVGMDVDFYNILSVIRGKFWGLDEQQISGFDCNSIPSCKRIARKNDVSWNN